MRPSITISNKAIMGNHSSNLQAQSVLSVSQPRLVATTSKLLLHVHQQRPKSDTDLYYRKQRPPVQHQPRPEIVPSRQIVRRTSSRRGAGYKARSASLRRQRSILRRNGHNKGKNRAAVRRTIEFETEMKMIQEQKELYISAGRGDLKSVEAMVDSGTDVNSADENQQTALHYAAMHRRDEVILSLIDRGADVNATDLKGGFSALHWVVINADPQCGKTDHVSKSLIALVNGGCKVNITDFNFATPLHIAAQKGNKVCIVTLMSLGADPDKVDITGRSCMDIAKDQETKDFIKTLKKPKELPVYDLPETRPRSLQIQQKQTTHFYHVLELTPPPTSPPPPPPPPHSSTPPPPPPRRRRRQYVQYDMLDTHIYHVLEIPPATMNPPTPPRRRKAMSRRH